MFYVEISRYLPHNVSVIYVAMQQQQQPQEDEDRKQLEQWAQYVYY